MFVHVDSLGSACLPACGMQSRGIRVACSPSQMKFSLDGTPHARRVLGRAHDRRGVCGEAGRAAPRGGQGAEAVSQLRALRAGPDCHRRVAGLPPPLSLSPSLPRTPLPLTPLLEARRLVHYSFRVLLLLLQRLSACLLHSQHHCAHTDMPNAHPPTPLLSCLDGQLYAVRESFVRA